MSTYAQAPTHPSLIEAAAQTLGREPDTLPSEAHHSSFVALGGTSLSAVDLVARAEHLGLAIDLAALLGGEPLAETLAAARPVPAADTGRDPVPSPRADRAVTAGENAMLVSEDLEAGHPWRLLFSVDLRGELDRDALLDAVQELTDRHEALRTVYFQGPDGPRARVVPQWQARVRLQELALADGEAGVDAVHAMLAAAAPALLRPFDRPPVVFTLTKSDDSRHVLSLLVHHVVADGWSIGLLWRELFDRYQGRGPTEPAPGLASWTRPDAEHLATRRIGELSSTPTVLELPGDLRRPDVFDGRGVRIPVPLSTELGDACVELASTCGVTRNVVLLAAWSLAVARRAGVPRLITGLSWVGRSTRSQQSTVALGTSLLPVRCEPGTTATVRDYVQDVGRDVRAAIDARDVPVQRLAKGLGAGTDPRRNPLVQVGFAAHDEMLPDHFALPGLDARLYEGHCGGATLDALLYVQRWGRRPLLSMEYATSVLAPGEAALLVSDFLTMLRRMTGHPEQEIRTVTAAPSEAPPVEAFGAAPATDILDGSPVTAGDVWQLVARAAARDPHAPAVTVPGRPTLSYAALVRAVEAQSAALHTAGVRDGDRVVVAVPRSAEEIVGVLAAIRIGAAYIGIEPRLPAAVVQRVAEVVRPAAVLAFPARAAELAAAGLTAVPVEPLEPWGPLDPCADVPPPAAPDPERVAYIAFTSGSTGRPKAVRIPHRAVLRLVLDPQVVRPKALARFLRFAPLSFDASTLELFTPLAAGGSIVIHPDRQPTTAALARFLNEQAVTGLWLTAGLFRLVADHEPAAFGGVDQVLTGGDVVPAAQVRRVLECCPGLRISNGYGPTENTTFTTVHHLDDAAAVGDTVPIGRPIAGTDVLVVDEEGRPVPRGAVGELYTTGRGLALDYLDDAEETARRFVRGPDRRRHYRTGDLVRWDGEGDLRILGRRDHQVKIRGFRVELEEVAAVLRGLPDVTDAVAAPTTTGGGETRIVAGIVAAHGACDALRLRALAAEQLPEHAVPSLWSLWTDIDGFPLTANGKVDVRELTARALMATSPGRPVGEAAAPAEGGGTGQSGFDTTEDESGQADADESVEEIEDRVADIWERILGTSDFGYDDRFFDVGGDSLQVPQVRNQLAAAYPGCQLRLADMFRYSTVEQLAAYLHTKVNAG